MGKPCDHTIIGRIEGPYKSMEEFWEDYQRFKSACWCAMLNERMAEDAANMVFARKFIEIDGVKYFGWFEIGKRALGKVNVLWHKVGHNMRGFWNR